MQSDSPRRSRSAGGWDGHRGEEIRGKGGERERARARARGKLGSSSSSPRRPHASAVPRRLPLAPGAVAMAAVAVLRNDSLQAFLQVSTRARGPGQLARRHVPRLRPALRGGSRRLPPPSRGFTPRAAREREVGTPAGVRRPSSGSSGWQLPPPARSPAVSPGSVPGRGGAWAALCPQRPLPRRPRPRRGGGAGLWAGQGKPGPSCPLGVLCFRKVCRPCGGRRGASGSARAGGAGRGAESFPRAARPLSRVGGGRRVTRSPPSFPLPRRTAPPAPPRTWPSTRPWLFWPPPVAGSDSRAQRPRTSCRSPTTRRWDPPPGSSTRGAARCRRTPRVGCRRPIPAWG